MWNVNTSGSLNNNNANNSYRSAPDYYSRAENLHAQRERRLKNCSSKEPNPAPKGKNNDYAMPGTCAPDWLSTRRRYKMIETITDFEHLYESMNKCRRGVGWKDSVMSYTLNGIERNLRLEEKLKDGTYTPSPTKAFKITNPKPRDIISVSFRDRVYQRSLNDNVLYPTMTNSFIYDNWACQKGKGTLKCRERLKEFLLAYYRKYGHVGYTLQCDIRGYYPNMSHEIAEAMFRAKLPQDIADATVAVLRNQYDGEKGYNPGSQMIQIAGISMLDKLDHYIKERLHIRYYIRYMDDFILIHHDPQYLSECREAIRAKLRELRFQLHETKTRIYPLSHGILFLGFRFMLTDTGKVVVLIDPKRVKAARKKYVRLAAKCRKGLIPRESVDASWQCWRQHASYGNSWKLIRRLDAFYRDLWRDDDGFQNPHTNQRGAPDRDASTAPCGAEAAQ